MVKTPKKTKSPKSINALQPTITGWLTKSPTKPKEPEKTQQQVLREKYKKPAKPSKKKKDDKKDEKKKGAIMDLIKSPLNIITKPIGKASTSEPKGSKKTLTRFNSASSDELPSYSTTKAASNGRKRKAKQSDSYKKYGAHVPSAEELITTQNQLSNYKSLVEEAQDVREPVYKTWATPEKNKDNPLPLLDCKQLSLEDIDRYFRDNLTYLSQIVTGKIYSDRHKRFYDKENLLDFQVTNNLISSTSTIVFTFEQIDRMVALMRRKFDPQDLNTSYSFKVLVPELCLRIFMDVHGMNKREANQYLLKRPI